MRIIKKNIYIIPFFEYDLIAAAFDQDLIVQDQFGSSVAAY